MSIRKLLCRSISLNRMVLRKYQFYRLILGLSIFFVLFSGCNRIDNSRQATQITKIPNEEISSPIPSSIVTPTLIAPNPTHSQDSNDLSPENKVSTITSFQEEAITDIIEISQNGSNSSAITAEETIQQYFKYWQEKNSQGMNSLVTENKKGMDTQFDSLNSITLDSYAERTDKGHWDPLWFDNPYDFTCVDVSFTVDYIDGEAAISNGTHDWQYYLVKEAEASHWIIVMWGAKEGE